VRWADVSWASHVLEGLRGMLEVMLLLLLLDPLPRSAKRTVSRKKALFRQSTLIPDVRARHDRTLNSFETKNVDDMVDLSATAGLA
jgi:hypothetical protein